MIFLLLACSDTGLHTRTKEVDDAWPAISVTPERLDFWQAGLGDVVVLPMTVYSVGEASLRVESITITGDTSFTLPEGGEGFDLAPGESREIPVAFAPMAPGDQLGEALIVSDDEDTPELAIPLSGGGEVPYLTISPDPWEFGTLPAGCTDEVTLTLQNVGTDDLDVESWSYGGTGFTIVGEREPPFTLEPYAYTTATVTFAPSFDGDARGELSVVSNDPRGVIVATQTGAGQVGGTGRDAFTSDTNPPVDILLAVDQSDSMDDDAVGMAAAFGTFITALGTVTNGWNLGVVTTDSGCFNGGVLTVDSPDLALTFTDAVSFGDDRDIVYDEALFQLVDMALRETAAGGCNEGFLRSGAPLHVIVVSDEPERSTESASAWTPDWYLARWGSYVVSEDLLRISGVLDTEGCNEGDSGYAEAVATTGGDAISICTGDWSDRLLALATASLEYIWTFPLSAQPVPSSIAVTVDGTPWTTGWTWDAGLNAVVMDTLDPGQDVEITYDLATECP